MIFYEEKMRNQRNGKEKNADRIDMTLPSWHDTPLDPHRVINQEINA